MPLCDRPELPQGPPARGWPACAAPWDGKSRVNLLLLGLDYRDWEDGGPSRTDTMILLTLDPETRTAGMLSIPRDLWVASQALTTARSILPTSWETPTMCRAVVRPWPSRPLSNF